MSPITYVKIMTTLTTLFLTSCATMVGSHDWLDSYRNCPVSNQAYFRGIPLASHNEHAQAERFAPLDPVNCLVYIVRSDWAGSKSSHAKVFLYKLGNEPPDLPPDYWPWFGLNSLMHPRWSERHMNETPLEFHKAEIFTPYVYAMWEIAPGSYVLDVSLSIEKPFARAIITCAASQVIFFDVTQKFLITDKAILNVLDENEGRSRVIHRLRSAGMQPGGPLSQGRIADRKCQKE